VVDIKRILVVKGSVHDAVADRKIYISISRKHIIFIDCSDFIYNVECKQVEETNIIFL